MRPAALAGATVASWSPWKTISGSGCVVGRAGRGGPCLIAANAEGRSLAAA